MAPYVGRRAGGQREHRRLRRARLCHGHRRRRTAARSRLVTSGPATALPPLEVGPRIDRLRATLESAGCDALIVTSLTNVRYLTGFTGSAGLAIVSGDDAVLITDGRYETQAVEQVTASGAPVTVEITTNAQREVA